MFKKAYSAISFITLFSLSQIYMMKAHADLLSDYVSRETQEVDQRRSVGSGSRSDCESEIDKNSVSLLIPEQEVIHHTSLERPSFFLTANKLPSPRKLEFTLVNPHSGKTLTEKTLIVSDGVKEIDLPKSTKLELNQVYLWNIAIPCSNNSEKYREVLTAAVKRSQLSQSAKSQIYKAKNSTEVAKIYSKNGFWYEALEIAVKERNRDIKHGKIEKSNYLENLFDNIQQNYQNINSD